MAETHTGIPVDTDNLQAFAEAIEVMVPDAIYSIKDGLLIWLDDRPAPTDAALSSALVTNSAAQLAAYAATKRWQVEVAGVVVNGIRVPTDDRAKLLLMGAATGMADGSSAPLIISGINYGTVTKAEFQAIYAAVTAHTQSTFPVLASVLDQIAQGTITTVDEIDAAGWPGI